jgi:ZIP family zinc transporter
VLGERGSEVSEGEIILLGLFAGLAIFIGLPVGRARNLSTSTRALLNAASAGVLVFLLIETFIHGFEPVEHALEEVTVESGGSWGEFIARATIFTVAFGVGLLALVYYDRWMRGRTAAAKAGLGPGAASVREFGTLRGIHALSEPKRLALFIAIGIGVHNLAEGLAIGQSAANDEISLAVLLIIGFGVHNATEGFGIVAPMAGEVERPSWAFLGLLGLIGGLPVFFGTVIGQSFVNENLNILFLGLAAGSILYVVVQLLSVAFKFGHKEMLMWGLFGGVVLGAGTELVLVAAGL